MTDAKRPTQGGSARQLKIPNATAGALVGAAIALTSRAHAEKTLNLERLL